MRTLDDFWAIHVFGATAGASRTDSAVRARAAAGGAAPRDDRLHPIRDTSSCDISRACDFRLWPGELTGHSDRRLSDVIQNQLDTKVFT